jgi:hypothetical protein
MGLSTRRNPFTTYTLFGYGSDPAGLGQLAMASTDRLSQIPIRLATGSSRPPNVQTSGHQRAGVDWIDHSKVD